MSVNQTDEHLIGASSEMAADPGEPGVIGQAPKHQQATFNLLPGETVDESGISRGKDRVPSLGVQSTVYRVCGSL